VMCKNCLGFNVQGSKAASTWALAIHFNQLQKMIMCGSILLFLLASWCICTEYGTEKMLSVIECKIHFCWYLQLGFETILCQFWWHKKARFFFTVQNIWYLIWLCTI
jgi:hypothetical protein